MRRLALAAVLSAFTVPGVAAQPPVRLYVFAHATDALAEPDRKAREKETEAAQKRAEEARKSLQKTLEARHGKDSKGWPDDARGGFEKALRDEYEALLAHHEVKTDPDDLRNMASLLAKSIAQLTKKQPQVALADSAEQADLSVEFLTRRAKTSFPAAAWFIYLKVRPARTADMGARFAGTSFGQVRETAQLVPLLGVQSMRGAIATLHAYSDAEPYWTIEVGHQGAGYGDAILGAAEALVGFAGSLATAVGQPAAASR